VCLRGAHSVCGPEKLFEKQLRVVGCQFARFAFLAPKPIGVYILRVTPLDGIFCKESFFLALYFQYFTEEWGEGGS